MKNKTIVLLTIFLILVFFPSCKRDNTKEEIKKIINKAVELAQERKKDELLELIDEDYKDPMGRDKEKIKEILERPYDDRLRGVIIKVLGIHFTSIEKLEVRVAMDIALTNAVSQSFRKIGRRYDEFYRIRLVFTKRGREWKVKSADWSYILKEDLFKESLKILEED